MRTHLKYIERTFNLQLPKKTKFLVHSLGTPRDVNSDGTLNHGRVIKLEDFIRHNWHEAKPHSIKYYDNSTSLKKVKGLET